LPPVHDRFTQEATTDYRTATQVDRDRILYASQFARLAEVTQVVSADRGYVFHNRLTHSLKVAQLARRLAEKLLKDQPEEAEALGGLDPDAAEAAGLAHDLGHPPFGHLAEEALNCLCMKHGADDGYEGNAQSFRIVTKLATSDGSRPDASPVPGLNLTRTTLNGLLKYPWLHGNNPKKTNKWGAYKTEAEVFEWVREDQPFPPLAKSLEAELMDWADDITFSVHDLIDFYCAGQIPLHQLAEDGYERSQFFDGVFERCPDLVARRLELQGAFSGILDFFPTLRYTGSFEDRCSIWQFATILISRYVDAIRLDGDLSSGRAVKFCDDAVEEVRMLKELTWHYVILHNELATDQVGHRRMVTTVFDEMRNAADKPKQRKLFPPFYKRQLEQAEGDKHLTTRIVADYIAGMSEQELVRIYRTLTGHRR
jgi:dGTPase